MARPLFAPRSRFLAALGLALVLSCLQPLPTIQAQTTSGTLFGQIVDEAGRPVADARITATNQTNGNSRSTVSAANGIYRIPFLPPGLYTIAATKPGFTGPPLSEYRIPLNSTTNLVPPITLTADSAPAVVATPVSPTPTAPVPLTPTPATVVPSTPSGENRSLLVNLNDPTRRGNFTSTQILALPLGGASEIRSFDEYALLVAGVAPPPYTPGVRGPGVGYGIGTAGQFSVNGQRARSNNFTVDGSDNNDQDVGVRRQGFVALSAQPIESVQEFQISTLLWNAEAGRNVGSQVNAVSTSGGNQFHGQVYSFFNDSALNARDFFDGATKPPYTRLQSGAVVGGPIVPNRVQFLATFEHQDINASTTEHFAVPTAAERNLNNTFGSGLIRLRPEGGFVVNGVNFDYIQDTRGTFPVATNILSFYPFPNNTYGPYGANTYTEILPSEGDGSVLSGKVTATLSPTHSLSGRYNFTDDDRVLPSVNQAIRSTIAAATRTQNLSLILDSGLSPTLFNQARVSFGRTHLAFSEFSASPFVFSDRTPIDFHNLNNGETYTVYTETGPIGVLTIEPFSTVGVDVLTFPQQRASNTYQFADSLSWQWRQHAFAFGADIRRIQANSVQERNYRPSVTYNNGVIGLFNNGTDEILQALYYYTGIQLADIGLPSSITQTLTLGPPNAEIGLRSWETDFFVNDSWRIRPNLVLDFGVRYEYNSVPHEVNDRIEDAVQLKNVPPATGGRYDAAYDAGFYAKAVDQYKQVLAGRSAIYDDDRNNFAPHVGFAWDPFSDGKTALRGGYAIAYDTILGAVVSQSRNIFPYEFSINIDPTFYPFNGLTINNPSVFSLVYSDSDGNFLGSIPFIKPGTLNQIGGRPEDYAAVIGALIKFNTQGNTAGGLAFTLPDKNLRTPYAQQWHLTAERELFRDFLVSAAYIGTKGTKLTRLVTPNGGPTTTPFIPLTYEQDATFGFVPTFDFTIGSLDAYQYPIRTRKLNRLGAYQIFENSASSIYHAMQLELRKRYAHSYQFTVAYTWSHAIDDVSDVFPIAGAPVLPQDSNNLRLERGDANFDLRHRFVSSIVWDLPFLEDDDGALGALLGGWQIASIVRAETGQPFTINVPFDANFDGNLTDRLATTKGLRIVDTHGPVRISLGNNSPFSFISFGNNGPIGRNTFRADGLFDWDLAVNKTFRFGDGQDVQFRAEVFNVTNRANFGIPVRRLDSPGFGASTETATPPRMIQFAVKYRF